MWISDKRMNAITKEMNDRIDEAVVAAEKANMLFEMLDKSVLNLSIETIEDKLRLLNEKTKKEVFETLTRFEDSIDIKIVGLFKEVDNKILDKHGDTANTVSLLKKIAKLENLKEKIEHRKPTQEVLELLNSYKDKILKADRNDEKSQDYETAVKILKWVLGEENA